MPEFILDMGSSEGAKQFSELDSFTRGYIEAAFFTETGTRDDEELEDATFSDVAPDSLAAVIQDCADWHAANSELLDLAYSRDYSPEQAGRDYWFTRNGHGVGFWDRDALEIEVYKGADGLELADESAARWEGAQPLGKLGDLLSDRCRYREVDLMRGDDGLVYFWP